MDAVNESLADIGRLQRTLLEILFHEGFIGFGGGFGQTVADLLKRPRQVISIRRLITALASVGAVTGTQFTPNASRIAATVLAKSVLSLSSPVIMKATEARPPSLQYFHAGGCRPAPGGGVNRDQSEIGGTYGALDLAAEIHESGRIDEHHLVLGVTQFMTRGERTRKNRDLAVFLLFRSIRNAGTVGDQTHPVIQPQLESHSIGEGRLSASAMPENHKIPDV